MTVSVLIPYRADGGPRDRLFAHTQALWADLDVEMVIGHDSGGEHFNCAQAFNEAFSRSTGDTIVMYGGDHLPDAHKLSYAEVAVDAHPWAALYANTATYDRANTDQILNGRNPDELPFSDVFNFCTGVLALRRETWLETGGMDERFDRGWGGEDTAYRCALNVIYPNTPQPTGTLRHLWHPLASRDGFSHHVTLIQTEYEPAAVSPDAMRQVLARAAESRKVIA